MASLLVIDDDRTVLLLVKKAFADSDLEIHCASDAEAGMAALREYKPDVLLLDIMLPEVSGMELAREIRGIDIRLPVIFITATNDSDTAIEAMKMGAYDYLLKPLDIRQVRTLVERALETRRLMNSPVRLQEAEVDSEDSDILVGRSPKMLEVYKQIGRVAAQDVTVLIRGESGSGKELIARALYQHSHRNGQCFMAVNCAALTDTLLESELFGHEKGAFTGADRRHIGRFEQCNGGTIFLDEVGDMSPATQSKVLRLLQEQKFERVGGHDTISVDVRLISATNRDLEQMIEQNEFRLDLFHRLNGFEIQLPPLRERVGDLKLLLDHFLKRFNSQLNKNITSISPEAAGVDGKVPLAGEHPRDAGCRAAGDADGDRPDDRAGAVAERHPRVHAARLGAATFHEQRVERRRGRGRSSGVPRRPHRVRVGERLPRVASVHGAVLVNARTARDTGQSIKAALRLGITRGSLRNKMRELGIQVGQVVEGD